MSLNAGKHYHNITWVNDCSSMVMRMLGLQSPFYDPSPGLTGALAAASPQAVRVYRVDVDPQSDGSVARDLYIDWLESRRFLGLLPYMLIKRHQLDSKIKENGPDELMAWTEAQKKVLTRMNQAINTEWDQDTDFRSFLQKSSDIAQEPNSADKNEDRAEFLQEWKQYQEGETAKNRRTLDPHLSPNVARGEIMRAQGWLAKARQVQTQITLVRGEKHRP